MSLSRIALISFAFVMGCSDEPQTQPPPPPTEKPSVERGKYVVDHLGPCAQCHTPKLPDGKPDDTKYLGGDDCFLDVDPMDPNVGCIAAPNITNHPTGLANRSDAEIKNMITKGMRPDGSALFPIMPSFLIARFTETDIDSIVMYLRTLTPVDKVVAPNQPPFDVRIPAPPPPLGDDEMPMPTVENDATMRGRYLATVACISCHTPLVSVMDLRSLDKTKLFAGGNMFVSATLGYPTPPFPDVIQSTNLTPHPTTGLGYTKQQLVDLLKTAKDKTGGNVCPPMPIKGAYQGLTDADMSDLADYILALPPIDNAVAATCVAPP
jgi:mono/diheme cytochrome c family protein